MQTVTGLLLADAVLLRLRTQAQVLDHQVALLRVLTTLSLILALRTASRGGRFLDKSCKAALVTIAYKLMVGHMSIWLASSLVTM